MYLAYKTVKTADYPNEKFDVISVQIEPGNADPILLKACMKHDMQITNPAKTFADNMKMNEYSFMEEEQIATIAEACNFLFDLWHGELTVSVFKLCSDALLSNLRLRQENAELEKELRQYRI